VTDQTSIGAVLVSVCMHGSCQSRANSHSNSISFVVDGYSRAIRVWKQ